LRKRLLVSMIIVALVISLGMPMLSSIISSNNSPKQTESPAFNPSMNISLATDVNRNQVADSLEQDITSADAAGQANAPVNVTVMLKAAPTTTDLNSFHSFGGNITTPFWSSALYGFGGCIPYGQIVAYSNQASNVLLVEKEEICNATLAYAASQIGARPYVWNTLGLQSDPQASVAVIDTGIDGSHTDFSPGYGNLNFNDKIVGWNNQVTSLTSPFDDNGHGSHCSGLAAGDGFFSVDASGNAAASSGVNFGSPSSGTYFFGGMMVNKTGTVKISVEWKNSGSGSISKLTSLSLYYGDKSLSTSTWTLLSNVSTPNQNTFYQLAYNVASIPSGGYNMYHVLATINTPTFPFGSLYVFSNMSWPYTPPNDGFSAWTGIAPQSKLVGVKVLDSTGSGTSTGLINGINWLISNRAAYHITVASMSLGFASEVTAVDAATANLVNSGISTVVAAGNSGSGSNYIYSPGSVDEVLTVAAMNQFDGITSYSSQGGTSHAAGNTVKPDITAPGGSVYGVPLYSVDTNYNDAEGGFSDFQSNDAAPMQGTSMATPIVAGADQLVVQALGGFSSWNYTRSQALMPKMLLLMTASETYPNLREAGAVANSASLERGGKDAQEGYGRVNINAAVDAVLKTYRVGTLVTDTLGSPPTTGNITTLGQSLVWARNVQLLAGTSYSFTLTVPAGADYDLYLYNSTGTAYGEPIILTKSTSAALGGTEEISFTPTQTGKYYLAVKLAYETSGSGQFTLTSTPTATVHLALSEDPSQSSYNQGQSIICNIDVINQLNPALNSTLFLTINGPRSYAYIDFQTINITTDTIGQYSFSWIIPNESGAYSIEASLVPTFLTAYDTNWIYVK
jgi:subtilisin family serine protease